MASRDEQRAARLLDDYLASVRAGQRPDVEETLKRCPESQRQGLRTAIGGAMFVIENYEGILAPPQLVEAARARLEAVRRRQQLAEAASERLARHPPERPVTSDDVLSFLEHILGMTAPEASGEPATAWAAVRYRSGGTARPSAQQLDPLAVALAAKRASDHAYGLWCRFGSPDPPVDPKAIADWLGLVVIERETQGCDGCILMDAEAGGILVNAAIRHVGSKRFTLAHEVAHFELHRAKLAFLKETLTDIESYSNDIEEVEASAFAAELLMPRDFVQPEFAHREPSFWLIDEMSERCQVSKTAAARRLVSTSDYACAVLYTTQGRTRWFEKSEDFPYYLAVGGPPPRYSAAAVLVQGGSAEDHYTSSEATWWAPEDRRAQDAELLEHSRRIYEGTVLTLLYAKDIAR